MTVDDLPSVLALWANTAGGRLNESDAPTQLTAYLNRNPQLSSSPETTPTSSPPSYVVRMPTVVEAARQCRPVVGRALRGIPRSDGEMVR